MAKPGTFCSCSASALAVKSTRVFALRACKRDAPLSHGKPRRNFFDRTGRGPFVFALCARENEPQGSGREVVLAPPYLGQDLLLPLLTQQIVLAAASQDVDLVHYNPEARALARNPQRAGEAAPATGPREEVENTHFSDAAGRDCARRPGTLTWRGHATILVGPCCPFLRGNGGRQIPCHRFLPSLGCAAAAALMRAGIHGDLFDEANPTHVGELALDLAAPAALIVELVADGSPIRGL